MPHALESQLYLGHIKGPCPYLPQNESSLLFMGGRPLSSLYRMLLDEGYRRHGKHFYRPDCPSCRECRVFRVPVATFRPSRSQRRVWKKGRSVFTSRLGRPRFSSDRLALYRNYLQRQHDRSDLFSAATEQQYRQFFLESCLEKNTVELRLYADDQLVGLGIFDRLQDALSAVYFMFHSDAARYSPGTFAILLEIALARRWGLGYFYPGYYIRGCRAMNYKIGFAPGQIRRIGEKRWQQTGLSTVDGADGSRH